MNLPSTPRFRLFPLPLTGGEKEFKFQALTVSDAEAAVWVMVRRAGCFVRVRQEHPSSGIVKAYYYGEISPQELLEDLKELEGWPKGQLIH